MVVYAKKEKSKTMFGQKQSWLRDHQVFAGFLVVGLMVSLGITVGGIPLSETLFGNDGDPQVDGENNPVVKVDSPTQIEVPKPSWHLNTFEENQANLVVSPTDPHIRRVEVTRAETNDAWHIQLTQKPLPLVGQEWYSLRFRARAEDVRKMGAAVSQAHDPWENLGLYRSVALMKQWQDYEWEFRASSDDALAQIQFDLGGWKVPVEIGEVRLLRLSHKLLRWRLNLREGSEAGLEGIHESPLGIRVAIANVPNHNPQNIQMIQDGLKLQANEGYRIRFHARADEPRDMFLAITQAQYPWEGLGFNQTVSLTSEWQPFEIEFVAKNTEDNARLYFDLGQRNISVEINAVLLQRTIEPGLPDGDLSMSPLE